MLELWFNAGMLKDDAIKILGGSAASAADLMGVTYQAVNKWPQSLPLRISDRVLGACVRNGRAVPARFIQPTAAQTTAHQSAQAIKSEARQQAQGAIHG